MPICEILEKTPTTLKQAQTTADSSFQPQLVGQGVAVPTGPEKIKRLPKGLEEFDTDK